MDPFETLAPLIAAATVRIHAPGPGYAPDGPAPRPWGSGFFIAPNWVLTCAHVAMRQRGGGREVGLTFGGRTVPGVVEWAQPEENPAGGLWPAPDLALIRMLEPAPHGCVWLSERTAKVFTRKEVAFFGCTEEDGQIEDISGRCTIRGELGTDGRLKLGNEDEIPEGCSGGPLVDLDRGEVIGVLKARRGNGRDGGLAISVVQLRRLPTPPGPVRGERHDLYQRVLHAHDRYHADQHRNDHVDRATWTDGLSELRATASRALTPGQRVELLGLLAELPPPVSARSLDELVTGLRGQPYEGRLPAPRGWRDGIGLLYDLRQGRSELEAVLRYAVHVATADRPYPAAPEAERALWDWAARAAADAELPRAFRTALSGERAARLRLRRETVSEDAAPSRPAAAAGRPPAHGRPPAPEAGARSHTLLEITPRGWERGSYDWRVCVARPSGELVSVDEDYGVRGLDEPPERLRAALAESFRRGDEPGSPVTLQVALPYALLGFPVDQWRVPPQEGPLGRARPVVVRRADRAPADPHGPGALAGAYDGDAAGEVGEVSTPRQSRWKRAHVGPMRPFVLDCDDGRPESVPAVADLLAWDSFLLPVLCRAADPGADPGALRQVMDGGHDVVLWRREPVGRDGVCADFHRGAIGTVSGAGQADRLPAALWRLRADLEDGVPEAYWAAGITLLYDDPTRPLPGADQPLEAP
ncbi:trypsin-like peptidase domain-containing protein [Streptomyces sp. NPDC057702]|uniref:VMAP-C domain-containing protein n=1 Tax=Streptomyces sp. NPDC057702 TaxID=3346221 RepID=UPI0036C9A040